MSADFSEFAEEAFDPVAWINATCTAKPGDEQLEKYLAEIEMRLQLTAEEIEASLQDYSTQAMRRIPFAIQEIYRLQGDIQGLQVRPQGLHLLSLCNMAQQTFEAEAVHRQGWAVLKRNSCPPPACVAQGGTQGAPPMPMQQHACLCACRSPLTAALPLPACACAHITPHRVAHRTRCAC